MAQLKVGDRVSHKRQGCRRERGTVVQDYGPADDNGRVWVGVSWDSGATCWWELENLKLEKPKAR